MRNIFAGFLPIIGALLFAPSLAVCAGVRLSPAEIVRLRGVIVEAEDFGVAGRACDDLFPKLDRQQLWDLTRDANIGIALCAYAELHNSLVAHAKLPPEHFRLLYQRKDPTDLKWLSEYSLSSEKLARDPLDAQRFFGFLESRVGLKLPRWWEEAYLELHTVDFVFEYEEAPLGKTMHSGFLEVPTGLSVTQRDGQIAVRRGDCSFSLPKRIVDELEVDREEWFDRCNAAFGEDIGVVAFVTQSGSCFLFCVKNNEVLWRREFWGPGYFGMGSGVWVNDFEVSIQGDVVAVFGTGGSGTYVEVFDKKTGKNIFRFSQSYWIQRKKGKAQPAGSGDTRDSGQGAAANDTAALAAPDLDISAAVFTYMFAHAGNFGRNISRRLVSILDRCPPEFAERLRKRTGEAVLSPLVESTREYPNGQFLGGRYSPKGDDSLFYEISAIQPQEDGTVDVRCSVRWHSSAARGFEYTLKKRNGEWVVVRVVLVWTS